jgi:hypothetical protein
MASLDVSTGTPVVSTVLGVSTGATGGWVVVGTAVCSQVGHTVTVSVIVVAWVMVVAGITVPLHVVSGTTWVPVQTGQVVT